MRGHGRDLEREGVWRKMVLEQSRSGMTVREFCKTRNVKPSTFEYWKRTLGRRDVAEQTMVPITVGPADLNQVPLEISLPGGVTLRVTSGCDQATFRMVLEALQTS